MKAEEGIPYMITVYFSSTTPSMMQAADAVEEIFRNLGIDHLISTVKDILKLRNLILFKMVTREEFEQVLKAVDIPAEKRALLMAFEQVTGERSDEKLNSMESEIREAIKQAGLDDNVWVRKIKEGFKLESVEQLKSVTEEQVEVFLKPIQAPIQSVLVQVFEKVTPIDVAKLNISEKSRTRRSDITAAEAVRSVQGGVLCQGIFFSENVDHLVQEREMVIDVSEKLEFKETRSVREIFHNEFTCKETMQTFVNHLDKCLSERSASIGLNICGVSLDSCGLNCEKETPVMELENYLSSVHYQKIPVATVDIRPNEIQLKPEVISALQHVEKSVKKFDYEPHNHFKDFFKIYGSHINQGTIEFGGTLVSAAYCEGFREEDRRRVTDAVIEVSEAALLLDVNKKVRPGQTFNAFEVFGRKTGINAEDLKNISVVVKKVGGSLNAEKDDWKKGLRDNCKLWEVVQRASQPKPIWKILQQHRDQFENYLGIASAMQEEWKRKSRKKENCDNVPIPEKERSKNGNASEEQKPEHERVPEMKYGHANGLYTQKPKDTDSADVDARGKDKPEDADSLEQDKLEDAGIPGSEGSVQKKTGDKMANVSREVEEMQLLKSKINEEDKQRNALRSDIKLWIDRYRNLSQQTVDASIKSLASLRKKYDRINQEWQSEVIYLQDVQTKLLWTGNFMKKTSTNPNQKIQLAAGVNHILFPLEEIRCEHFPNFRQLIESLKEVDGVISGRLFTMDSMRQLPDILKQCTNIPKNHPELDLKTMQERLENTVKALMETPVKSYEHLIILGSLHLLGLHLENCLFDHTLVEKDLSIAVELLEAGFQFLDSSPKAKQQAYILNLGLCSRNQRQEIIQDMRERMPGGICIELREACKKTEGHNRINLDRLQEEVDKILQNGPIGLELKPLIQALTYQFRSLHVTSKMERGRHEVNLHDAPDKKVEKLLEALGMRKYYPQKLQYEDVLMMQTDVHDDVNQKPTSLLELPWYFMRHIIGLDSDTRENCHVPSLLDADTDDDASDDGEDETVSPTIHPLDLIYIIFLCADDFLRQELSEKMTRCQYAVPFILPDCDEGENRPGNLILHWGLKSMTRNFYSNNNVVNKTLVDVEAPLISCVTIGEETSWKPKLLNKMLSPQQETFWHQGLKGGDYKQRISQGMVEVAWYLPGRHGDNKFPYPVTFVNVRENAMKSRNLCDRLHMSSTLSCIFAEDIGPDLKTFLRQKTSLQKVILVLLHSKEKEKKTREDSKQLQLEFNLEKHQVIRKVAQEANFNSVFEQLKQSIERMITMDTHSGCLSTFVMHEGEMDGMEVDDTQCYHGSMAAESILRDIDEYNGQKAGSTKDKILPCQSDLPSRKGIAGLEKELCRQRKLSENKTVQKYGYEIEENKWKLQLNQLRKPMSDSFKYFLHCLLTFHEKDRKYFLQCLKLGLNERSIQQLQPLYEEYEKWRVEDESQERSEKLKELDEQLTYGSLGIEHFFREMAVTFENTLALKKRMASKDLDEILNLLTDTMATVFLQGTAIEIMDGDAVNVHTAWLNAVLKKIEHCDRMTLFKVAVLGAQSCGKSTLLNTIFGLNFPVSSGRCTRGAYMQLVKVGGSLRETLHCDYVAVIDSEGLMSRTKVDGTDFDNELSTFIIGLSDLTLVIIKGEGSEMHDVLPLAIHVFLRMNIVGEHQACHFVHQNMGVVDVMTKVATEIEAFVRDLNAKTLAAAKDVDQSDQYTKFMDVLHYDPTIDNTYVPGLWDGALPMGKTNSHYSKTMAKLKSDIATSIVKMETEKHKRMCTFTDFTKRLEELWTAIKYENFVLSFKNVLAVEAHKKLSKVFKEEHWKMKREVRDMIQKEEHVIENDIKGGRSNRTVKQMINTSQLELTECLFLKIAEMEKRILHYFQCSGCKDCSAEVKNRHLLANNEKEFKDEVRHLHRTIEKEIEMAMENLEITMRTDKRIHELSTSMDGTLKMKVQDAIKYRKAEHLSSRAIEDIFEQLWSETTGDILRNAKHSEKDEKIEVVVQAVVRGMFGTNKHLYLQLQADKRQKKAKNGETSASVFNVDFRHMKKTTSWYRFQNLDEQDLNRLQLESDRIIAETSKYYNKSSSDGKRFNQKDAELLFKEVLEQIEAIKDDRFKTTSAFTVDLVHHIEIRAVEGFIKRHEMYCAKSSPRALLEEKKKSYHDLFIIKMGQGDAAAKFCDTVLKDIILKNIEEQLSCTELLHDLRVHCGEMFRDIKSIQASIMVKLYKENKSNTYLQYIGNYKQFVIEEMNIESKKYFTKDSRLKVLAEIKLDELVDKVQQGVERTVSSPVAGNQFMKTFFTKIENLKISHNEASAYMELDVPDKMEFAAIIHQQLEGRVKNSIMVIINEWDTANKLEERNLADFLFDEVVGCSARCPFCKAPCDNHSGGKTQGNHSATLHRPEGLGGVRYKDTEALVADECASSVASEAKFRSFETNYEFKPFKAYHKWYPDWTIHGNSHPDVEKYWKWVLAQHNRAFAHHYNACKADVPPQWVLYRKAEIAEDIQDNYHIQVDISK